MILKSFDDDSVEQELYIKLTKRCGVPDFTIGAWVTKS